MADRTLCATNQLELQHIKLDAFQTELEERLRKLYLEYIEFNLFQIRSHEEHVEPDLEQIKPYLEQIRRDAGWKQLVLLRKS